MSLDEELQKFRRELNLDPAKQEWIERLRGRLEKIGKLIEEDEKLLKEAERLYREGIRDFSIDRPAFLSEIERLTARIAKARGLIGRILDRAPRLARIAGLLGHGVAEAAQFAGKALRLVGHVLIPLDIILFITENPSNIAVPYKQYDSVDTYLVNSSSGDEVHCYLACVYEHTFDRIDDDERKYPVRPPVDEELVMLQEYPCDRPPSFDVMMNACKKTFYIQAE